MSNGYKSMDTENSVIIEHMGRNIGGVEKIISTRLPWVAFSQWGDRSTMYKVGEYSTQEAAVEAASEVADGWIQCFAAAAAHLEARKKGKV